MEHITLGIVGCGLMGSGIAQVAVQAGHTVVISDTSAEALQRTRQEVRWALERDVRRELLDADGFEAALARLVPVEDLEGYAECRVIVESIKEDMAEKKKLLASLDALCPPEAVLASNTSALSITDMATATSRGDRVGGLHFHLPVTRIRLVDVIPGLFTSRQTIQTLTELGQSMGKEVVVCRDTPGFIVNRLLVPYLLDAIRFLEQGVADRDAIDTSMRLGCNHPMGPLLLADYIGLDTLLSEAVTMFEGLGEERFRAPLLLTRLVAAGHLGVKNGRGFYRYDHPVEDGDRRAQLALRFSGLLQPSGDDE